MAFSEERTENSCEKAGIVRVNCPNPKTIIVWSLGAENANRCFKTLEALRVKEGYVHRRFAVG